jgi:predicted regulator of Ras-like GTPase activity (Roadblock/LC7/MglB family)
VRWYIPIILKDKGMNGKLSVNKLLIELSKGHIIMMGTGKILLEVTKKGADIGKIMDMKLSPKILGT